jgi:transport protein
MFRAIARFTTRFRYPIIAVWVIAAALMVLFAPKLSKVGVSDSSLFLAENSQSVLASRELLTKFPSNTGSGGGLMVFTRDSGLTDADMQYARSTVDWLNSADAPKEIRDVESVFQTPALKDMLVSADGSSMMVNVTFKTAFSTEPTNLAIDAIRAHLSTAPDGLSVHVTGGAGASRDTLLMVKKSVDATTLATIILVIVVLLLIYRSPIAAAIPLLTIGTAYLTARGLLGFLAQAGMRMSTQTDVFIVVIIFGVGTDYCLFIISRFREELDKRSSAADASVLAMERIGAVITASAVVVMLGFLFLNVAQFQLTRSLGMGMALAILVTLAAGMTLTPALMRVAGSHLFWPFARKPVVQSPVWRSIAEFSSRHARIVVPAVVAVLLVPYIFLPQLKRNFDFLTELPASQDSVKGYKSVVGHFDQGELSPLQIMLVTSQGRAADRLRDLAKATEAARGMPGVRRVRSLLTPTGDPATAQSFLVETQLSLLSEGIRKQSQGIASGSTAVPSGNTQGLATLDAYLAELGARFPEAKAGADFAQATAAVREARTALEKIGPMLLVSNQLDTVASSIGGMMASLQAPSSGAPTAASPLPQIQALAAYMDGLARQYPEAASNDAFKRIVSTLAAMGQPDTGIEAALRPHAQLRTIAGQIDQVAKAAGNPAALSSMNLQSQFGTLLSYLTELSQTFPALGSRPEFASTQSAFQEVVAAGTELQSAGTDAARLTAGLAKLSAGLNALADYAQSAMPNAVFVPKAVPGGSSDLVKQIAQLGQDITQLAGTFRTQYPTAQFVPTGLTGTEQITAQGAAAMASLQKLTRALDRLAASFAGKGLYLYSPALLSQVPEGAALGKVFLSEDGTATRFYVVLDPAPYSNPALDLAWSVRQKMDSTFAGSDIRPVVTGEMIGMADMRHLMGIDFNKVLALTVLGVLAVMMILLRSVVAPLYLVATVVLSFGSTMGLSILVFQDLLGHGGLNMLIQIMVLVLLVALGADYNIFLMARVREETEGVDFGPGLIHASARTGAIITSCGLVLAGTFATMTIAPLRIMLQLGGTVAIGVLLDTFLVRAILVPAIASLLKRWNWWPGK